MRLQRYKSIKKKIFSITMISLIALVFVFVMSYNFFTKNLVKEVIQENTSKSVQAHADIVGNWIEERKNEIESYATNPSIKNLDWEEIEYYLQQEMLKKSDIYTMFFVADLEGNYYTNTQDSFDDFEGLINTLYDEEILPNPWMTHNIGKEIVVITVAIEDNLGYPTGFMGASLNASKLSSLTESFKTNNENSYSYIIDKNGLIISHPDENLILKENIAIESEIVTEDIAFIAKEILEGKEGNVIYTYENIESEVYYKLIPNTDGWKLVCKLPTEYILTPINTLQRLMIITGIIGFALAFAGSLFFINKNTQPIIELKKAFDEAAAGDLTVRAKTEYADEIGEAGKSFNTMMDQISKLTYFDSVTGLPNRDYIVEEIINELQHRQVDKKAFAITLFSLNKFKTINDMYGFNVGDKMLKEIGRRIRDIIGNENKVVRMSGDEFLILFYKADTKSDIIKTAEEIIGEINKKCNIDQQQLYITTCGGIVFFPEDGSTLESLLKNVGIAKLKAKEKGHNHYQLYNETMDKQLTEEMTMERHMHHALEKQQFFLNYQPFVDMENREVVEAEALIRWEHPEKGLIPPNKFIPLAEKNGLIVAIGNWVLKEACRQNKVWQDKGYKHIVMSVNISLIQFEKEDFIQTVKDIIEETQLNPKYLQLEITEGLIMKNTEENIQKLHQLKDIGVKISIDDFGTGFSSLSYLIQFPIDSLKIDRTFIKDVNKSKQAETIVSTIISLSTALGIQNIAEGIETIEQLNFIKKENCHKAQGYIFSRPVMVEEFENILAINKKF